MKWGNVSLPKVGRIQRADGSIVFYSSAVRYGSNPESFVGQEISLLVPIDRQTRLLACDLLLDYRSLARRINQLVPIFRFPHAPSCVYPTDVSIDCPCALPSKKRIILVAMMYL